MQKNNALLHETSPYLLQHAHNPVNWFPWGEAAFVKAREEQKPVFLSIGYSTCHWCHVMERESFEDDEVAALLNESFVAVKVDKEERPDIDAVYMEVCQALTGGGGWPLTILMTPEQKPFFAGTYFPKRRSYGQPGLMELLPVIREKWRSGRDELLRSGDTVTAALTERPRMDTDPVPDGRTAAENAAQSLGRSFDTRYGGFGGAPKFPTPHHLLFLLRCHHLDVGSGALEMVERTLTAMYRGGIYDHVGGGFSRYSTDERWLTPHFEKMLYDNALLVMALAECFQVTGNALYSGIAARTLDYVRREMTVPQGGFASAQDADSEGEEGKYYTYSKSEILQVLGADHAEAFCRAYGVTQEGNFEGNCILNLLHRERAELPDSEMDALLEKLLHYRSGRYQLHRDDKVLTSWNALMIAACAKAWQVLGRQEYLEMAETAYQFLEQNLTGGDGALLISFRGGRAKGRGLLDDYAYLAWACLELYACTFQAKYLGRACRLMEQVLVRFSGDSGGFYLSAADSEPLLLRPVEQFDNAVPSGNSVAAWCLARLAALTGETRWREAAQRQLEFYGTLFTRHPTACTFSLLALLQESCPAQELLVTAPAGFDRRSLARSLGSRFHPQTTVLVKTPEEERALAGLAPFTAAYPIGDKPAYYLCRNHSCSAPVFEIDRILAQLI